MFESSVSSANLSIKHTTSFRSRGPIRISCIAWISCAKASCATPMTRLYTPAVSITRRTSRTRRLALEVSRCVAIGVSCRPLQANIQLVGQGLGLKIPKFRRLRDSSSARMDHGRGKDSHHLGSTRRVTDERTMELEMYHNQNRFGQIYHFNCLWILRSPSRCYSPCPELP